MTIQIALLGAGRIGQVHAKAVAETPRARLVAVHDTDAQAGETLAARHGTVRRTIDEIARARDVDAVLICTPTDTHADLIERFARAGKAVFCEKPVDLDAARVRACLAVVAKAHTPLMVGFNRRFDPHFAALKRAIDAGRIGAVEMITITSRDPAPPPVEYIKASGGIFRDMTIHDFDMARYLLDEEVTSVFATASVLVDPGLGDMGDYDSASVILSTAGGKQCLISNSRRAAYGYDQRIEVLGALGMIRALNQRPEDIEIATHAGFDRPPLHDFFMTRYCAAYACEIAAFVEALEQGKDMSPSGDDGLRALLLAEAALASVQSGQAEVPDDPG